MARTLDWRDLVYYQTKQSGGRYNDHIYFGHLEEAFTACIRFIRAEHPTASLNYRGSDMGGERYEVEEV